MNIWFAYLAGLGTPFLVGFIALIGYAIHDERKRPKRE